MSREAMQRALDVLEDYSSQHGEPEDICEAINALRAELAESAGAEPVDEEVIAECERIEGRTWWTGGTWLYPGDTVVVRRAAARGKG